MSVILLNAATATGAGSAHDNIGPVKDHTVAVNYVDADASILALVVNLEGCIFDPTTEANWFTLASHTFTAAELTALAAMFHVIDKPVRWTRANITTATGIGAGDTVTVRYEPFQRY